MTALPELALGEEWYAVQTRHCCEHMATDHLRRLGIEALLAVHEEVHTWSDRRKLVLVPMFPGYVFVHIHLREARLAVLRTPGVRKFVTFNGSVASIEPAQIDAVRLLMERKIPCSIGPCVPVGTRIRIEGGVLDGIEGTLSQSSRQMLVITIEPLQRSITIDARGYKVVPV